MSSIFTKIINREILAEIIWENEKVIIFMDAFPQLDGQILVVPKAEVDHFYDLEKADYEELFRVVKEFSPILKKTFNSKRIVLVVEGFEVPHVHIKLYPANTGNHEFPTPSEEVKARIRENAMKIRENSKYMV